MTETMEETLSTSEKPTGALEHRDVKVAGVQFAQRLVRLIVMPYDERATVEHRGRMITESVAPGAFNGIQRRLNGRGIKANRDHDVSKVVGRVVNLDPDHSDGLVADVRIANTTLGNETLNLADEGLLDASAGFAPLDGGEKWVSRDERRLTRLYLGHVAFVGEPAFEGARVLSVREKDQPSSATPLLDEVLSWKLAEEYARLSESLKP